MIIDQLAILINKSIDYECGVFQSERNRNSRNFLSHPNATILWKRTFLRMSSKLCLLFIPVFCIPQRVIMSIMCFLAIAIAYAMRVCLSVAITEMVAKVNHTESSSKGHYICPADPSESGNSSSAVKLLLKFHYSLFPNNSPYSL